MTTCSKNNAQTTQIAQTNHDPSSSYYIHPSDVSSTQLVSSKFSGTGFNNWKVYDLNSIS